MGFRHKQAYKLTESEIRYAMESAQTNCGAALHLRVTLATYKRYAELYYDAASGKNLYQLGKNQGGIGVIKKPSKGLATVEDIFNGNHPNYPYNKLKDRLISEGVFGDQCANCGYHALRRSDFQSPTMLAFINGDEKDRRKENMEIICYNCYFLHYGDLRVKRERMIRMEDDEEIVQGESISDNPIPKEIKRFILQPKKS